MTPAATFKTRTDFNGVTTGYGYDLSRNLETSRTELKHGERTYHHPLPGIQPIGCRRKFPNRAVRP